MTADDPLRRERRQVTVMFCDLVESVPMGERLDEEQLLEITQEYQGICARALREFGAEIHRHVGDGLLICFGYPVAHEDDASRAVRAGLALIDAVTQCEFGSSLGLGLRLGVRIGIDTGWVAVGEVGGTAQPETQLLGRVLNIAQRLQAAASPNTLIVSPSTSGLVGGQFNLRDLGPKLLKGIDVPMQLLQVLEPSGAPSRFHATPEREFTRFIGRQRDVELLSQSWRAVCDGHGRAIFLDGEAGVGKSRLARALRSRILSQKQGGRWFECFCRRDTVDTAFAPIYELAKQALATLHSVPVQGLTLAHLSTQLERAGLEPSVWLDHFSESLSIRGDLVGATAKISPEHQRYQIQEQIIDWTLEAAVADSIVVLIEDLHWSDPSSRAFIGRLLERIKDVPLLCLFTFRPEFENPWSVSDDAQTLIVNRLTVEEIRELVTGMPASANLDAALLETIASRADGIPLFAEELVNSARLGARFDPLLEEQFEVPMNLRDSLMARLDELGKARDVAQFGAALGREFSREVLGTVFDVPVPTLEEALDELVKAEILLSSGDSQNPVYRFKHALIQDTAHDSLLKRERRALHALIAQRLTEVYADEIGREPERVARHLVEAGEYLRGAQSYDRAGRLAASRAAYEESLGHYRKGLAALGSSSETQARSRCELSLLIMQGNALMITRGYGAEGLIDTWTQASALAEQLRDSDELSSALNGAAVHHMQTGDCDTAIDYCEQMLRIAHDEESRIASLRAHGTLAQVQFYLGRGSVALEHAEKSIACYEPGDFDRVTYGSGYDQGVIAHGAATLAHWWVGNVDKALVSSQRAVEIARAEKSSQSLSMALSFLGIARFLRREYAAVLQVAKESESLAGELSFPIWLSFSRFLSGASRSCLDHAPEAVDEIRSGFDLLAGTSDQGGLSFALALLAEAQLNTGDLEGALGSIENGILIADTTGQPYYTAELMRLSALVAAAEGQSTESIEQRLREALDEAEGRGANAFGFRICIDLATLLLESGRMREARSIIEPAISRQVEGHQTADYRRAVSLMNAVSE